MIKHTLPLVLLVMIAVGLAPGQLLGQPIVSNVVASQRSSGDRAVVISYDLSGTGVMTVSLLVSNDNGQAYEITPDPQFLSGDVGSGIMSGTDLTIVWDAMADLPDTYWPETRVRVIAVEEGGDEPAVLTITSTLADGSVSDTDTQTLTFTFSEPVTEFDASDVFVNGATKVEFRGDGAVYELDIAGLGGIIDVAVPQNVVSQGNNAASFSNFYQDTWTLTLPGDVPMELIRIPAGTFTMGSPESELSRQDDETQHQATISQDFYLGKTEVTQAQWLAIQGSWPDAAPSALYGVGDDYPAYYVSYDDIQTFLTNLDTAIMEPGTFSLPTETQWEYACRAGTTTRFNFGDGFGADETCSAEAERTGNMGRISRLLSEKRPDPRPIAVSSRQL